MTPKAGLAIMLLAVAPALAQWFEIQAPGIPRLPDGSPDLSAPAPKTPDGRLSIAGLWRPNPKFNFDLAVDLEPGEVPLLPSAEAVFRERQETLGRDDTQARCLPAGVPRQNAVPYPYKIVETPGLVVILYEYGGAFRQIFTDGRELPEVIHPAWIGYSVGRWEDDAFVVETAGFNDFTWLDDAGHPHSDAMSVTERFIRRDFGHMDIEITIDDSKTYAKPWTVTMDLTLTPDTELLEFVCNENERSADHLVGQ